MLIAKASRCRARSGSPACAAAAASASSAHALTVGPAGRPRPDPHLCRRLQRHRRHLHLRRSDRVDQRPPIVDHPWRAAGNLARHRHPHRRRPPGRHGPPRRAANLTAIRLPAPWLLLKRGTRVEEDAPAPLVPGHPGTPGMRARIPGRFRPDSAASDNTGPQLPGTEVRGGALAREALTTPLTRRP
jgi:hypothetical protein